MIGNNCGHMPDKPRWFAPPEKHANRPGILRRIIQCIRDYYAKPGEILPGLNAANESDRQQRSERREACVAILGCILHYTDLVTLRVGIPQPDGSMAGLTMPFLAELSGLGERRAERAIRDLKAAGIITVHSICQQLDDATYKGFAAIRTVTKHLFTALGLSAWLEHERRKAQERKDKKTEKKRRKGLANVQMTMNAQHGPAPKTESVTAVSKGIRTNKMSAASEFFAGIKATLTGGTGPP
ncbi:MAG: replication protein RepA [Methylococcales bacterium]|nr:replication protein RepA [Methylococcales bacterium]